MGFFKDRWKEMGIEGRLNAAIIGYFTKKHMVSPFIHIDDDGTEHRDPRYLEVMKESDELLSLIERVFEDWRIDGKPE